MVNVSKCVPSTNWDHQLQHLSSERVLFLHVYGPDGFTMFQYVSMIPHRS